MWGALLHATESAGQNLRALGVLGYTIKLFLGAVGENFYDARCCIFYDRKQEDNLTVKIPKANLP